MSEGEIRYALQNRPCPECAEGTEGARLYAYYVHVEADGTKWTECACNNGHSFIEYEYDESS